VTHENKNKVGEKGPTLVFSHASRFRPSDDFPLGGTLEGYSTPKAPICIFYVRKMGDVVDESSEWAVVVIYRKGGSEVYKKGSQQ
jgi:hypothetical protein